MRLEIPSRTALRRSARVALACSVALACLGTSRSALAEPVSVRSADVQAILGEVRKPGAKAVLVNVWATWCDPCRAEMPGLLRFFREHRDEGLRLVLVSVDDEGDRDKVVRFLTAQGVDFQTWMKRGDDMTFINTLSSKWSGAIPASFLFNGRGRVQRRWYGEVTPEALKSAWDRLLTRREGRTP